MNEDIAELNVVLDETKSQRTKDVLSLKIRGLQTELDNLLSEKDKAAVATDDTVQSNHRSSSNSNHKLYEIKLNNYGWDQTHNAIKLYIMLKDVQNLSKEAISCHFAEKPMDLRVFDLNGKDYNLPINNLCEKIGIGQCYVKVKTDTVMVFLAKETPRPWLQVTSVENRLKESKAQSVQSDRHTECQSDESSEEDVSRWAQ